MRRILTAVCLSLLASSYVFAERNYSHTLIVGQDANSYTSINQAIVSISQYTLTAENPGCIRVYPGTYVEQINSYYPGGHDLPAHCDLIGMGTTPQSIVIEHKRRAESDPNFTQIGPEIYADGVLCDGDNLVQNLKIANVGPNQNSIRFKTNGSLLNCIVDSDHDAVTGWGHLVVSGCTISGMYRSCIYAFSTYAISDSTITPATRSWGGEHPAGIEVYKSGTIDNVTINAEISSSDYVPHYDYPWLCGVIAQLSNRNDKLTITNSRMNLDLTTITHQDRPNEVATWQVFGIVSGGRNPTPTTYYPGTVEVQDCSINVNGIENGRGIMVGGIVVRGSGTINILGNTSITTDRTVGQYEANGYEYALVNQNGTICVEQNDGYDPNFVFGTISVCNPPQKPNEIEIEPELFESLEEEVQEGQMDSFSENLLGMFPWPPELKYDNIINFLDYAKISSNLQKTGISLAGDFDDSNTVDINDVNYLTSNWLTKLNWPLAMTSTILSSASITNPVDLAFDPNGYLYVLSASPTQVKIFDQNLALQTTIDVNATNPRGLDVYLSNEPNSPKLLYIADSGANRIIRYINTSGHNFIIDSTFGTAGKIGQLGTGDGDFNCPEDVEISSEGNLFVADSNNNRIHIFEPNGAFITKWGDGQLNSPVGACLIGNNDFAVADANNQVQRCAAYSGLLASRFGEMGSDYGQFLNPARLHYDIKTDQLLVADAGNNRVQFLKTYNYGLFSSFRMVFGGIVADQNFASPQAAITDPNLDDPNLIIYVADTGNNRILKLRVEPDEPNNRPVARFAQFVSALEANDVNEALALFTKDSQEKYAAIFQELQPQFGQMASDIVDIVPISNDGTTAVYDILREEEGDIYGYPVVFVRDELGNWKITKF
ncbi:MAG: hypothetical protein A2Y12_06295 [Planctomycetes bacterium GWF2_42_9]|nr:MAG: hypothetical protein A2Y12_06295 [Planctomycetes bacterium GWF2_42_9]